MHNQEFLYASDSLTSRAFFVSGRTVVQSRACVFQNIFFPVYMNSINSILCFNAMFAWICAIFCSCLCTVEPAGQQGPAGRE